MSSVRSAYLQAFAGLLSLAAALGIGRFVFTPILPFMLKQGALSELTAGLVASSNYLGYMLGALLASYSLLPFSQRVILVSALSLSTLSLFLMGETTSLTFYLIIRFAAGVLSAYVFVYSAAIILEKLIEVEIAALIPLHFSGVGFGIASSSALIETLERFFSTQEQLWLLAGSLSLLYTILVLGLLGSVSRKERTAPSPPARQRESSQRFTPRVYILIFAYGLFGFGYVVTATFMGAIADALPQLASLKSIGWLVVGLSIMPSVFIWTKIAQKIGNSRAIALACFLEAIGVALSVLMPNIFGFFATAILLGGTFVSITALGIVEARIVMPQNPRKIIGLMTVAFGVGQIIGPSVSGALFERTGSFFEASLMASSLLIIAGVLFAIKLP